MALKGNLKDFSLAQLLNLIRLAHKTGCLVVEAGGDPLRIFALDGRLTGVAQNGRGSPLGPALVRAATITEEQLKLVRGHLGLNTDKELALRLVDLGAVSPDGVRQVIQRQALEALFPVFPLTKGAFNFDADARLGEDAIAISMDLEAVVLEGGRRIRESGRLQEAIPTLDIVPRLTSQRDAKLRSISLTVDQWKAISFINARNSLRQISDYSGLTEFQLRKAVQDLRAAGLVEMDASSGKAKTAKPPPGKIIPSHTPSRNIIMRIIDRVRRV
jgi:hypothetical protein